MRGAAAMERVRGLVLALIAAWCAPAAEAQQGPRVYRVGIVAWNDQSCNPPGLAEALTGMGYAVGRNLLVECRSAGGGRYERLAEAARELVQLNVDAIMALSHPAARAAKQETDAIPIVMIASGEPVAGKLVASISRPGGNVTGLSYYATELTAKRLELLRQLVPNARRFCALSNPQLDYLPFEADTRRAAVALGVEMQILHAANAAELDRAFKAGSESRCEALLVLPDLLFAAEAARIGELAHAHRLPPMAWAEHFVRLGALAGYSADYVGLTRRAAVYLDKILRGVRPAELPIEQPTKFEFHINLRTARALGLTISDAVLARADEVIE